MEVLGDRWSLIVIRDMMFGNRRHFRELMAHSLEGIASNILADRLVRLEQDGIVEKDVGPAGGGYRLTAKGLDLLLVAPATADILAKFAHGIADDFLSTFYLAVTAPVLVAPAMNVWMWEHPATQANLGILKGRGVRILEPEEGILACGDEGIGRMADPESIVAAALGTGKKKLRGRLKDAASS